MYALSTTTANAHNLELFLNMAQVTVTAQLMRHEPTRHCAVTVTGSAYSLPLAHQLLHPYPEWRPISIQ